MSTTETTAAGQDYADKVAKLLAKAERAATPEEAEAFSEKAMALMAKYGIDQAILNAKRQASGQASEEIVTANITIINPYSEAKARMVGIVAMKMRCQAMTHPDITGRSVGRVTIIGFASDVERAVMLGQSLLAQMSNLVVHQSDPWGRTPARTWRKNWALGFGSAVARRVAEFEAQAEKTATTNGSDGPSTALVLMDRKALVERRVESLFPNAKAGKTIRTGTGFHEGVTDGRKADINFGNRVGGTRTAIR